MISKSIKDKLIVIKDELTPLEYYIYFVTKINIKKKTISEIAKQFYVKEIVIINILNNALNRLKKYQDKDIFINKLAEIKTREGDKYNKLKITPVMPSNIIKLLFITNYINKNEKKLYKLTILDKYEYTNQDLAKILNISLGELESLKISLKNKIIFKFGSVKSFQKFSNTILKKYGINVYKIYVQEEYKSIDYQKLYENYQEFTLEEILQRANDCNCELTKKEIKLLKQYFGSVPKYCLRKNVIINDMILAKYGLKNKSIRLPQDKLYQVFLDNISLFTLEQQLYLNCYFFNKKSESEFKKRYPNSNLFQYNTFLFNKLESLYYGIYAFFESDFTKERYIKARDILVSKMNIERIKLLDLYYGVDGTSNSMSSLATLYNVTYPEINDRIQKAKIEASNLFFGLSYKIRNDKDIYVPYILDVNCHIKDETRNILKLFIIDKLNYEEISRITNLNTRRISNIIVDGLRLIDFYRFKLTNQNTSIKEALKDKELDKVPFTLQELKKEINLHKSESILTNIEKEYLSLFYGIRNIYNREGLKLSPSEIAKKFTKNNKYVLTNIKVGLRKVKAKKKGTLSVDLLFFSRKEMDKILNDKHLPLKKDDYELICYLFELKGYPYKTPKELCDIYNLNSNNLRSKYLKAIVTIKKYLLGEIEGKLDFDEDISPLLKYFPPIDRLKIIDCFKSNIYQKDFAIKYGCSRNQAQSIMMQFKLKIYGLIYNSKNTKKFDFEFYEKNIDNPKLPFYGNLELAKEIFNLAFGINGNEKLDSVKIIEKLGLKYEKTAINNIINSLMLAMCKLKDGITKEVNFTINDVINYYNKHMQEMTISHRRIYENYFNTLNYYKIYNGLIPNKILIDLIKELHPDFINLDEVSKEYIEEFLRKYEKELNSSTKLSLMSLFNISNPSMMNGKEKKKVLRILGRIESKRKELDIKSLILKKENKS